MCGHGRRAVVVRHRPEVPASGVQPGPACRHRRRLPDVTCWLAGVAVRFPAAVGASTKLLRFTSAVAGPAKKSMNTRYSPAAGWSCYLLLRRRATAVAHGDQRPPVLRET